MRPGLSEQLNTMTALNCKVGDLAIVVATELPQILGQIVKVLGLQTGTPPVLRGLGHIWHVRVLSGRKTLVYRYNDIVRFVEHAEGPAPDHCLRPVSGLDDDDGAPVDVGSQMSAPRRKREPKAVVEVSEEAQS